MVTDHGTRWLWWRDQKTKGAVGHEDWAYAARRQLAGPRPLPSHMRSPELRPKGTLSSWSHLTSHCQISLPDPSSLSCSQSFRSTHCLTNTTQNSLADICRFPEPGKHTLALSPAPPPSITPAKRMIHFYLRQLYLPPLLTFCSCCFLNWTYSSLVQYVCLNPVFIHSNIEPQLCQVHLKCHLTKAKNSILLSFRKSHLVLQFLCCLLKACSTLSVLAPTATSAVWGRLD